MSLQDEDEGEEDWGDDLDLGSGTLGEAVSPATQALTSQMVAVAGGGSAGGATQRVGDMEYDSVTQSWKRVGGKGGEDEEAEMMAGFDASDSDEDGGGWGEAGGAEDSGGLIATARNKLQQLQVEHNDDDDDDQDLRTRTSIRNGVSSV